MGLPLDRPAVYRGVVRSVRGTALDFKDPAGWARDALAGKGPRGEYYQCLVEDGALAGASFLIVGNSDSTIFVDLEGEDLGRAQVALVRARISIHPFWTPETIFAQSDPPNGTAILLYDESSPGLSSTPVNVLTYYTGYGWYDSRFLPVSQFPVRRGFGMKIRLPLEVSDRWLKLVGDLPVRAQRSRIRVSGESSTDRWIAVNRPTPVSLAEAGIALADRTTLFVWESDRGYNRAPERVLTYFYPDGWYDAEDARMDEAFSLEPGAAYLLRVPPTHASATVVWALGALANGGLWGPGE